VAYYQRHLPHWQPEEAWLFGTWRLAGSLPVNHPLMNSPAGVPAGKAFVSLDRVLDRAAGGPVWLKDPRVASMVCDVIQQAESPRRLCRLGGYVVMSNHVHLLAQPLETAPTLTHWIKGLSARYANQILNRTGGSFWQHEYFDRWVRNSREYARILNYTEQNPVRAGLVTSPEQWLWSSAATRSDVTS
jgi:REP element-mobilizing transposase RayT